MNCLRLRNKKAKILAVSSGGGHWIELIRLSPAFQDNCTIYVTVNESYQTYLDGDRNTRFYCVGDVTRWNKIKWMLTAFQILWILIKERPTCVISTGALPGYMALRLGKLLGANTIWVDSIANVEELSESGRRIGNHADLWLTQWQHLAKPEGPEFRGSVI